ncbi:MAG TPA: MFS transporter, partial [Pirellulales bacterium]
NLRPLAIRHFALGLGIKVLYSVNLYVLIGLLAGYMIDLRGYQWYQGALVISPGLAAMVASLAVGTWLGTDGNRKLRMFLGLGGMAAATLALSNVDVYTAKAWQAAVLCCWGAGAGLVCGPGLLTMFEGLSNEETLASAGVFNIARSLPAFLASGLLAVLVTQHADENFDWIRLKIRDNRPVVEQSMRQSHAHMIARGSSHDLAKKQTHAMLGQWVHANARAYALQDALRILAIVPCAGMLLVLAVRIPSVEAARLRGRAALKSQHVI